MNPLVEEFKVDAQCRACKGTGLYVGFAEGDGAAVVCHTCKGTGLEKISVKYTPFSGRQVREGVRRVIATNPGIGVGENDKLRLSDFGGATYQEWLNNPNIVNERGREMRAYTCPAWWYQSADSQKKPYWNDGEVQCQVFGTFSSCKFFDVKHKCWDRFDRENS